MFKSFQEAEIAPTIIKALNEAGIRNPRALCALSETEIRNLGRNIGREEVVVRAARLAKKKLNDREQTKKTQSKLPEQLNSKKNAKSITLDNLGLALHTKLCLRKVGITTVVEMLDCAEENLLKIHTLGRREVKDIAAKLKSKGLRLREGGNREQLEEKNTALKLAALQYNKKNRAIKHKS